MEVHIHITSEVVVVCITTAYWVVVLKDQEKTLSNSSTQLQADFLAIYIPPSAEKKVYPELFLAFLIWDHVCMYVCMYVCMF